MDSEKILILTQHVGVPLNVNYTDILNMTCMYIISCLNTLTEPMEETEKEELFNLTNEAFSAVLARAFPEFELHPDLTEEAIMKMENELLIEKTGGVPLNFADSKEKRTRAKLQQSTKDHLKKEK